MAGKRRPPPAPAPSGLVVARFKDRPDLSRRAASSSPARRLKAWHSLRSVIVALRVLVHFGLPVSHRSVHRATALLATSGHLLGSHLHGSGKRGLTLVSVSAKAIGENDMCCAVVAPYLTVAAPIPSRARPVGNIPRGWHNRPKTWLIERLAEKTAECEELERKYRAAVRAQVPQRVEDPILRKLAEITEQARAATGAGVAADH